jgi:ribosomal protein S18 acetylase RimI-like enzyme
LIQHYLELKKWITHSCEVEVLTLENTQIRAYRNEDLPKVEALEARIDPYRPEDRDAVEAMFVRAAEAERANDVRWMPIPTLPPQTISEEFDAFWVAETDDQAVAGIIGVETFKAGKAIPAGHPLAKAWEARGDVVELRRLRIDVEQRRAGLGTRLCEVVIAWARAQEFELLIVNTTTPQIPALRLYQKLEFREVGLSYIGKYELVWLEMGL